MNRHLEAMGGAPGVALILLACAPVPTPPTAEAEAKPALPPEPVVNHSPSDPQAGERIEPGESILPTRSTIRTRCSRREGCRAGRVRPCDGGTPARLSRKIDQAVGGFCDVAAVRSSRTSSPAAKLKFVRAMGEWRLFRMRGRGAGPPVSPKS